MDIWQKMYEKAQALYQPQEVSDFVYADTSWLLLRLKMGKFSQAFVWRGRVVFSIYVLKGLPFSICIKKLVKLRSSVLSLFVTNDLMVDRLACLVGLVENF